MSNLMENKITIKKTYRANKDCKWIELLCQTKEDASKIEEDINTGEGITIYKEWRPK